MRVVRVAPHGQLPLPLEQGASTTQVVFAGLPEPVRETVLGLLARLIACATLDVDDVDEGDEVGEGAR